MNLEREETEPNVGSFLIRESSVELVLEAGHFERAEHSPIELQWMIGGLEMVEIPCQPSSL